MFHAKGFHGMMLFLTIVAAALAALLFTASGTAACAQEEGVRLPIVMYHDLTNNPLDQDDYTLSLEQLEQDLIAFEEHGFTPVPLSAVLHYVLDGANCPKNRCCWSLMTDIAAFSPEHSHCCKSTRCLRSYR